MKVHIRGLLGLQSPCLKLRALCLFRSQDPRLTSEAPAQELHQRLYASPASLVFSGRSSFQIQIRGSPQRCALKIDSGFCLSSDRLGRLLFDKAAPRKRYRPHLFICGDSVCGALREPLGGFCVPLGCPGVGFGCLWGALGVPLAFSPSPKCSRRI